MPPSPNVLTLEAVNALVPQLRALMTAQMARRSEIEERLGRLGRLLGAMPDTILVDDRDPI
jgi:hypothetical protein